MGHLWVLKDYASYEGTQCRKFHGSHCVHCLIRYTKLGYPLYPLLSLRKRFFNLSSSKIDSFVVLSECNGKVLQEYGIEKERIVAIPIPLSEEIGAPKEEDHSILYVGWIQPRKGPHVILEAMPQILQRIPKAKLYMIGEQKSNRAYEEKIAGLLSRGDLDRHVALLGRRPFAEVRDFLKKAAVLVIPEQWETIAPNALTEGMVFGKAIVASRIGGILDYINDGENGLLAKADDPSDFAVKIISILEDQQLGRRLGHEARNTGLRLFSEERVCQQLLDLYGSLAR